MIYIFLGFILVLSVPVCEWEACQEIRITSITSESLCSWVFSFWYSAAHFLDAAFTGVYLTSVTERAPARVKMCTVPRRLELGLGADSTMKKPAEEALDD